MMLKLIEECLVHVEDKRQRMKVRYPLKELILLVFCGVLCGCEDYEDIVLYGEGKLDFLRKYFPYKNGICSVATLSRVFSWLPPKFFTQLLTVFIENYFPNLPQNIISIDGKTARGSKDGFDQPVHNLTAFASDSKLVLSHLAVDSKTNEITAIPEMLSQMVLENALITIDAMGCQRDIAELIIDKKGDYLLGLKGNQGNLYKNTEELFSSMIANTQDYHVQEYQETEPNGGRIETRKVTITDNIIRLQALNDWPGLKSIIKVERIREVTNKVSQEISYYICSKVMTAQEAFDAVRSHWAIENSLHYVLDMSFGEDASRIRTDHAPENMNILRKITANIIRMLKNNATSKKKQKRSFKKYRKFFLISDNKLHHILTAVNS